MKRNQQLNLTGPVHLGVGVRVYPPREKILFVPEPTAQNAVPGVSPGRGLLISY